MDPFGKYKDLEIWSALEKARIKDKVASMPGQLTKPVKAGGSNLSMGEKQLLCLARAVLCRSKVSLKKILIIVEISSIKYLNNNYLN